MISDEAAKAAMRLDWELGVLNSLELDTTTITRAARSAEPRVSPRKLRFRYIETSIGERLLEEFDVNDSTLFLRRQLYSDGKKCASVSYDLVNTSKQSQVIISNMFGSESRQTGTDRPMPLAYYYVGKTPLNTAIKSAEFVERQKFEDWKVDVFKVSGKDFDLGNVVYRYYLDAISAVPVKIEAINSDNTVAWIWVAQKLMEVQGRHFPTNSKTTWYTTQNGEIKSRFEQSYEVMKIQFNETYDKTIFWPKIQKNVKVLDSTRRKVYQNSSPQGTGVTAENLKATQEVIVEPPQNPSVTYTWVMIVCGCACILSALGVWWRRR